MGYFSTRTASVAHSSRGNRYLLSGNGEKEDGYGSVTRDITETSTELLSLHRLSPLKMCTRVTIERVLCLIGGDDNIWTSSVFGWELITLLTPSHLHSNVWHMLFPYSEVLPLFLNGSPAEATSPHRQR